MHNALFGFCIVDFGQCKVRSADIGYAYGEYWISLWRLPGMYMAELVGVFACRPWSLHHFDSHPNTGLFLLIQHRNPLPNYLCHIPPCPSLIHIIPGT